MKNIWILIMKKDYMKYTFELSEHTITYRDTDIMEESLRQKTEFYQGFLKPNHIPFGAGNTASQIWKTDWYC